MEKQDEINIPVSDQEDHQEDREENEDLYHKPRGGGLKYTKTRA